MSSYDQWTTLGGSPWPTWWLYYWLGPVQIPPLPPWIGMTDRVTGQVWWFTLSTDQMHLQLTTQAPVGPQRIYAPLDGAFIGQYGFRLGVSNGRLVFDAYPEQGPGPFARTPTNNQAIAGLLMQALATPSTFDHLAFVVGSATDSIFAQPKTADWNFRWGDTDVLAP